MSSYNWTDVEISNMNHTAFWYQVFGTSVISVLGPIFAFCLMLRYTGSLRLATWSVFMIWMNVWSMTDILVHSGLSTSILGYDITILPKVLPDTCEVAKVVEAGKSMPWPCARDHIVEWYRGATLRDMHLAILWNNSWVEQHFFRFVATILSVAPDDEEREQQRLALERENMEGVPDDGELEKGE